MHELYTFEIVVYQQIVTYYLRQRRDNTRLGQ